MFTQIKPLMQEERQLAHAAAEEAVMRDIGERPRRDHYNHHAAHRYPPLVTTLITGQEAGKRSRSVTTGMHERHEKEFIKKAREAAADRSDALTLELKVGNPGITTAMIENLASATWYFTVSAYTSTGVESMPSAVGSKTVT